MSKKEQQKLQECLTVLRDRQKHVERFVKQYIKNNNQIKISKECVTK